MVAPQDINDGEALFQFLGKVLGVEPKRIEARYTQKKYAPFAPVVVVEDIDRDKAIVLEENRYLYPGLIIEEGFKRFYPLNENSAHVLGYVGKISPAEQDKFKEYGYSPRSIVGKSGVEKYYDAYLKGSAGGVQIEVNSRGQQVRLLSLKEPTKGQDISLTIDSDVQQVAAESLAGQTGVIIVMDMANGEVLGLTSSPTYDPNVFIDSAKSQQISRLFSDSAAPLLNRGTKGLFPPGSVFKVPVALGALGDLKINRQSSFVCNGVYDLGGKPFRCTHVHGPQNVIESLAHSCNIFYYHLGLILGPDAIERYARLFGLGRPTYIDLPFEEDGYIPGRRQKTQHGKKGWYPGNTLNFSIGQGDVLVTPLQLVRMMSTVANDGVEVQPHVIKSIGDIVIEQYNFQRTIQADKQALSIVQKGLRAAVTNYSGTAHALDIEHLYVAGKTGTAQTSGGQEDHSWFVGYAKNDKKNIAFCVFLEHGGSSHNACLVAREMLLRLRERKIL
jgi:penicillin-binding protein 2